MKHLTFITTLLLQSFVLLGQYDIVYDSTFSGDGVVTLPYHFAADKGVFLQSDGKIVLMGQQDFNNNEFEFTMMRIDGTGALDASYNNTGINNASTFFGGNYYQPSGVLLPNNDFVVAGSTEFTPSTTRDVVLHKYLANGIMDPSFGNAGALVLTVDQLSLKCWDLEVFDDSTLFVLIRGDYYGLDTFFQKHLLYKLNNKGILDSTFATNGVFEIPEALLYYASKMAIGEDGSFFLLGSSRHLIDFPDTTKIVKLNPDLTMDPGFQFSYTAGRTYISELGIDEDAKLIILGSNTDNGFTIWRLFQDGSPDNSFSKNGVFAGNFDVELGISNQIIEHPDGKLLISFNAGAAAMRINPNGTLDYSFDLDGVANIIPYTGDVLGDSISSSGMVVQPDGKMVFMAETGDGFIKVIRVKTRP